MDTHTILISNLFEFSKMCLSGKAHWEVNDLEIRQL